MSAVIGTRPATPNSSLTSYGNVTNEDEPATSARVMTPSNSMTPGFL